MGRKAPRCHPICRIAAASLCAVRGAAPRTHRPPRRESGTAAAGPASHPPAGLLRRSAAYSSPAPEGSAQYACGYYSPNAAILQQGFCLHGLVFFVPQRFFRGGAPPLTPQSSASAYRTGAVHTPAPYPACASSASRPLRRLCRFRFFSSAAHTACRRRPVRRFTAKIIPVYLLFPSQRCIMNGT